VRSFDAGNYAGTVPIPAFRTGDFSALLGPQIGTDALGRPILRGQIYDPFSTRSVGGGFIRDPVPGNNLATYISPFTGASLINSIGQKLINFYPTPLNSALTNNWSAIGLLADYSDEYSGRVDHNFSDKTRFRGSSENLHVVERFTRIDANTLRYQFTIDDPTTWTRPWTAEYAWPTTREQIYEYACHEGNYALGNILRGARLKERDEAAAKKFLGYLATAPAQATYIKSDPTVIATSSSADTSGYTKLQKKAVEYISSAKSISQFMDRDTRPDFASTVMIPALQQFIGNPNDIDGLTRSIESQKKTIFTN